MLPKESRSQEDTQYLIEVIGQIQFFKDLASNSQNEQDILEKCCHAMQNEFFEKNSAIFHYGEYGKKFYLILKGSVDLYIPKTPDDLEKELNQLEQEIMESLKSLGDEHMLDNLRQIKYFLSKGKELNDIIEEKPIPKQSPSKMSRINKDKSPIQQKNSNKKALDIADIIEILAELPSISVNKAAIELFQRFKKDEKFIQTGICKYKRFKTLFAGDHFGELALTTELPRTTSVIVSSELQTIILSKEDYNLIFKNKIDDFNKKFDFFQKNYSNSCSIESLNRFAYHFKEKQFNYAKKIYVAGEPSNGLYAIVKGEVQVLNITLIRLIYSLVSTEY